MSIKDLDFLWEVYYIDGTIISQLDESTNLEIPFKIVDANRIHHFVLVNRHNPSIRFIVNLSDGFIYNNKNKKIEKNVILFFIVN